MKRTNIGSPEQLKGGASGTDFLPYALYQTSNFTTPWGHTKNVNTETSTGTDQILTVYGQASPSASFTAGLYSDVVTVTVTY